VKLFFSLFFSVFVLCFSTKSQHVINSFSLNLKPSNVKLWEQSFDLSNISVTDFMAVSIVMEGKDVDANEVFCSLEVNGKILELPTFGEDPIQVDRFVSELIFLEPEDVGKWKLIIETKSNIDLSIVFGKLRIFSPESNFDPIITHQHEHKFSYFACTCPMPNFVERADWGASFQLNGDIHIPPATYTQVTHLIVHHSAGSNNSSNWKGVVAAIFDFHVNANGWQDVGYNWLIDPNGVIYEGRGGGDNVRGAHMCGFNNNTMGICVLGNFVNAEPSEKALESLTKLMSWKSCKEGFAPDGSSNILSYSGHMNHISGHKDGCGPNHTQCPGDQLYAKLNLLIQSSTDFIQDSCETIINTKEHESPSFTISPNPIFDKGYIQVSDLFVEGQIQIYNSIGTFCETIEVGKSESQKTIDFSLYNPGIYWLVFRHNNEVSIKQIIKI